LSVGIQGVEPKRGGRKDMSARRHGPQLANRRSIGREQAPAPVGTVAQTVQEAIDTGEAISVGAVNLVKSTARAAISGARDVVAAGSAAVAAVRGSIAAAREIGGDLGRLSGRVLNGTFDAAREIGKDLKDRGASGAKRPLAKATSQRRSRTSERERSTRRSA
jgi:hypothetical protein